MRPPEYGREAKPISQTKGRSNSRESGRRQTGRAVRCAKSFEVSGEMTMQHQIALFAIFAANERNLRKMTVCTKMVSPARFQLLRWLLIGSRVPGTARCVEENASFPDLLKAPDAGCALGRLGSRRFAAEADVCRRTFSSVKSSKLRVSGTSILPTLWPGGTVRVTPASVEEIGVGDGVVFACRRERVVVHCVADRPTDSNGIALITRGDAQFHDDLPVRAPALLGLALLSLLDGDRT